MIPEGARPCWNLTPRHSRNARGGKQQCRAEMQSGAPLVIDERSAGCRSLPLGTHFLPTTIIVYPSSVHCISHYNKSGYCKRDPTV
jgi:hypothetical protein